MSYSSIEKNQLNFENLVNDAIKLTINLKECETESDNLIYQTVKLNKDSENIKEYIEDMNILSNTSIKQPRKTLISSIQCESKKLKQLEAENIELKSTLQDYELTMKLMNQKYRNHILKLISHMNIENKLNVNDVINLNYKQNFEEQTQKIENLTAFIQKIMNLDISNLFDIQHTLTKLELENEGLRQMLGIAKENNSIFKTKVTTVDIGVQTDLNEISIKNDINNLNNFSNLNISIDMDISSSILANDHNSSTKKLNDLKEINNLGNKDDRQQNNKSIKDQLSNCATIKKIVKDDLKGSY